MVPHLQVQYREKIYTVGMAAFWTYKPALGAALQRLLCVTCYCTVQSFLLHSYGFHSRMLGLLLHISVFNRLVSHGPRRVPPRWHFSVRVNQIEFYLLQLFLKASVIGEHLFLLYLAIY
jgi:hypothetical protein